MLLAVVVGTSACRSSCCGPSWRAVLLASRSTSAYCYCYYYYYYCCHHHQQELAKFNGPMRLDRGTLRKLVPQPESEQVCPAAMQDDGDKEISEQLVERVLKQICSIEATASLWHPVDKSETDYYAYVKSPNSLSKIDGKWRAGACGTPVKTWM